LLALLITKDLMLVATIDLLEEHHAVGHGAAKESVGSQMQSMSIAVKVNCSQ
jgi:hypothetical protein